MTILVTGSRGKVGSHLIGLLHARGIAVRAGSADPSKLSLPEGVESVPLALDDASGFRAALAGVESVFLYCEPSEIDAFVKEAEAAGVRHVVIMSSDAVLLPDAADNCIAAPHLVVEQALEASTITATAFRCGALAGNCLPWAWALKGAGFVSLPFPDSYADPVNEKDIAEAALAALTEPRFQGRSYHLTGPQALTFAEQVRTVEEAAGRAIPVRVVAPEEWKAGRAGYIPADIADELLVLWSKDTEPLPLTGDIEELTGHPGRTFALWAEENAPAFRG
ncbi:MULTISPECIES: NAD(P)H-binding protein [Actinomycetes]|uniref:NAD(P)H-binding protein n=1 Tax=Actinomycetes TaxID=1760 RepID=UPI00365FCD7D